MTIDVTPRPLDEQESERTLAQVRELGYAVVGNSLSQDAVSAIREACRDDWENGRGRAGSPEEEKAFHGAGVKLLYNLHRTSPLYRELLLNPETARLARVLLQEGSYREAEPIQIALTQARGLVGEQPAQDLHIDSNLPGTGYCLVLQAMWLLDEFSEASGGTRLVPGSHRVRRYPTPDDNTDAVVVDAPAGSLVLFDGSLWHGAAEKTSQGERWMILSRYARWFYRPSFDHTRNTPKQVYEELTDEQRELLGFRFNPPAEEKERVRRMSNHPEFPA